MYKQGEIVLIPVPFTDLSSSKKRPVLIVSNDAYNRESRDIIVAAITSNLSQTGITISNKELLSGSLPKPSIIRADKLYTLNQGIIIKRIGVVTASIQISVKAEINRLLDVDMFI